uniref:Uncharacterized protein n=1 Tax=Anguilla anguilla TaxID=7936 RepID=A0A0E9R211_ANGAN
MRRAAPSRRPESTSKTSPKQSVTGSNHND